MTRLNGSAPPWGRWPSSNRDPCGAGTRIAAAPDQLERRPGYFTGPIEELANLNLNYFIEVADPSAWPTYANGEASFTLRITPLNENVTALPAPASETPPAASRGGCAVGGDGRPDPTLPALLAAGLGFFGWRRFKAGK
jgi:hypothetical protein